MVNVSVIVLNWNGKKHAGECLESLFKQTYKDYEILFVDNSSSDGSVEFVKKRFPAEKYPKLRILPSGGNWGQGGGDNFGIKRAKGKYVVLLDNDTKADKDFLKEAVKVAEKDPKVGAVVAKLMFYDKPNLINSVGHGVFVDGSCVDLGIREEDKGQYDEVKEIFSANAAGILYRKDALEDTAIEGEYLDADFFTYYEDVDLGFRLRLAGWKIYINPKAIVWHKMNVSTSQVSNLGLYSGIRNKPFFILKNYPTSLLAKYGPFIFGRWMVSFFYYLLKFNKTSLKARRDTFKMLPKMLHKRKIVQSKRKMSSNELEKWLMKRKFWEYFFFRYD